MMTQFGSCDGGSTRRIARQALACAAIALALTGSAGVGADADGRAEWRPPGHPQGSPQQLTPSRAPSTGLTREAAPRGNSPPTLGGIGPQELLAGRPWRLHIRARDPDGGAPGLLVHDLPVGARLVDEGGGWHRLDWTPPAGRADEIDLTVVAVDALDARIRSERTVRLEVRATDRQPSSATVTPGPAARRADPPAPRLLAPSIEPLASQIVSAGRTVSFRVAATLAEPARAPLLQIDRLPRNASFEENPDGSRTFYWPTGDSDQGEHRFRFTALHPDDERLRSRVDLFVIVGDPTRAITEPLDEDVPALAGSPRPVRSPAPRAEAAVTSAPTSFVPASPEEEPFLPQAAPEEPDYWASGDGGADGFPVDPYGDGADASLLEPDDPYFEAPEPGYLDEDGGMPLGPDGQPLEP